MGAWLAAKLGSTIFKAVGVAAIVALAFVSVRYGLASIKIDHLTSENARLTDEKAEALAASATWKATSHANEAELVRVSSDKAKAEAAGAIAAAALRKARAEADSAASKYSQLKAEIAGVAKTEDRVLGPVGQRAYDGLRRMAEERAKASP